MIGAAGLLLLILGGYVAMQEAAFNARQRQWQTMDQSAYAVDVLARTIYGEARGEGARGMEAVACVVVNRAKIGGWWGNDIASVCLKKSQFSCWLVTDPNRLILLTVSTSDATFRAAIDIAARAVAGTLADITGGATHYHTKAVSPSWDRNMLMTRAIGNHLFFREA